MRMTRSLYMDTGSGETSAAAGVRVFRSFRLVPLLYSGEQVVS
jgi:hypothetical protein